MSRSPNDAWTTLERKQRIEELFQTYRLHPEFPSPGVCHVAWEEWSALMYESFVLTPVSLRRLGWKHGISLEVGGEGKRAWMALDLTQPSEDAFRALEDGLTSLLERLRDENPLRFLSQEALDVEIPLRGDLPQSKAFLDRMYAQGFIPAEKKQVVVDLDRTRGAYMVSVDDDPLVIIDAMSQIATMPGGFTPPPVERALDEGRFDELVLHSSEQTAAARGAVAAFEAELRRTLPAALHHFSHASSGAEANEKAFLLARLHGPGGRRVIAFEGSFHGRTLVSLYSTWNPEKRVPYEIAGYESLFAPFPTNHELRREPPVERAWIALWASRDESAQQAALDEAATDALLRREIESLLAVQTLLRRDDICCVIIEPMQSEGGDNYGTARFFNGLRSLTRAWDVPLIIDEVQTGYGLSDSVWWFQRLALQTVDGTPDYPDVVTWAKKAQVGGLAAVWPDPWPTAFQPAGALRGAMHGEELRRGNPHRVERAVVAQLGALAARMPEGLVQCPRACGYAFAFDLPTANIADQVVNQRFYRGAMVYKAGSHTLRYRLNTQFDEALIARTVECIAESLQALVDAAGGVGRGGSDLWARMDRVTAPSWLPEAERSHVPEPSLRRKVLHELPARALDDDYTAWLVRAIAERPDGGVEDAVAIVLGELDPEVHARACNLVGLDATYGDTREVAVRVLLAWAERAPEFRAKTGVSLARFASDYLGVRVRHLEPEEWEAIGPELEALQERCYEPARRDPVALLERAVKDPDFIAVVAEKDLGGHWALVGATIAGPLEEFGYVRGPDEDVMRGRRNTLYSADVTVDPAWRSRGIGVRLKAAQIREALMLRHPEGGPRYSFVTGRNRVDATPEMRGINARFGAYEVARYVGEYGEPEAVASYYRIPLRRSLRSGSAPVLEPGVDMAEGLAAPLGVAHPALVWARDRGRFDTAAITKLTLSNFVTPDFARYVEAMRALAPQACPHLYVTSCRAETVDKTLRALRVARPAADTAVSFEGSYFGESTAAARSLTDFPSDPRAARLGWFDWGRIPHPGCPGDVSQTEGVEALEHAFGSHLDAEADVQTRLATLESVIATGDVAAGTAAQMRREAACLIALEKTFLARGAERMLGVFAEVAQEHTGRTLSLRTWAALGRLCRSYDVPLVVSEAATALFRWGGGSFWRVDSLPVTPDAVLWYAGGQLGHIFIGDRYYLAKPLQLISTWDGDELSARRLLWTIRAAHREPIAARAADFAHTLQAAVQGSGATLALSGLFGALAVPGMSGEALQHALQEWHIRCRRGLEDKVVFWPSLGTNGHAIARLGAAVQGVIAARG